MIMRVIGLVAVMIFSMVVIVTVVRMMMMVMPMMMTVRMLLRTVIGLERRRHLDTLEPVLRDQ